MADDGPGWGGKLDKRQVLEVLSFPGSDGPGWLRLWLNVLSWLGLLSNFQSVKL